MSWKKGWGIIPKIWRQIEMIKGCTTRRMKGVQELLMIMLHIAIIAILLLSTFQCRRSWPMDGIRKIWMKCDLCKAVKSNNRFPFSLHNGYQWRYEQRYGCFTQGHSTIIFNKKNFPLPLPSLLFFPRVCLFNVAQYQILNTQTTRNWLAAGNM